MTKKQVWVTGFLLALIFMSMTQFVLNKTESLPGKIYWGVKDIGFKVGDVVLLKGHLPKYDKENQRYLKIVGGARGDRVSVKNNSVFVNNKKIGEFLSKTLKGLPLTPIEEQIIPDGKVFVYGTHPRSYDARYKEFGLVDETSVQAKLWKLY